MTLGRVPMLVPPSRRQRQVPARIALAIVAAASEMPGSGDGTLKGSNIKEN